MRVAFIDKSKLRYPSGALGRVPLGGSQSAMLALAAELARRGLEVVVVAAGLEARGEHEGVEFLPFSDVAGGAVPRSDVAVTLNTVASPAERAHPLMRGARWLHWHQNDPGARESGVFERGQPGARADGYVFVSHWQASRVLARYGLPADRVRVIPNPLAPDFERLFAPGESCVAAKDPELLVYASAPNRGLGALVRTAWPALRRARPALRLEVFSGFYLDQGMRYVGGAGEDGAGEIEAFLADCAAAPGVAFERGLAKPALAARLKRAALLCYPCSFPETFCIALAEAMAAGCLVSTSDAGALPETSAGFARMAPFSPGKGVDLARFVANTLELLERLRARPGETDAQLMRQAAWARRCYAPAAVARQWLELLSS